MKKKLLGIVLVMVILFSNVSVVDAADASGFVEDNTSDETLRDYHNTIISEGAFEVDEKGHLWVDELRNENTKVADEYISEINHVNDLVDIGVGYFDVNGHFVCYDAETIEDNVYRYDKQKERDDKYLAKYDAAYPILSAYKIASDNKRYIRDTFQSIAVVDPVSAYGATVAIWVGKVRTGGEWDYKNVNGYAPYNRKWTAYQKNKSSIKTSEWFGNYNYGFTGRVLFTKDTLLLGGDAVSYVHNKAVDSPDDKGAIVQGFNESNGV
ncbi:MAG: hypothetical protein K6G05_01820 [Lachnospiraceae bacterium]|nr:hypothetical protein [Lachnospiraceae bacterium]